MLRSQLRHKAKTTTRHRNDGGRRGRPVRWALPGASREHRRLVFSWRPQVGAGGGNISAALTEGRQACDFRSIIRAWQVPVEQILPENNGRRQTCASKSGGMNSWCDAWRHSCSGRNPYLYAYQATFGCSPGEQGARSGEGMISADVSWASKAGGKKTYQDAGLNELAALAGRQLGAVPLKLGGGACWGGAGTVDWEWFYGLHFLGAKRSQSMTAKVEQSLEWAGSSAYGRHFHFSPQTLQTYFGRSKAGATGLMGQLPAAGGRAE